VVIVYDDIFGACLDRSLHYSVLVTAGWEQKLANVIEKVIHRTVSAQVATELGERVPHFGHCPVPVVRQAIDYHGRSAWAVAFVANLDVVDTIEFSRTTLDGTLNVVFWHALALGFIDSQAQTRIRVHIAAAHAGRNRNFANQLCKKLAAFFILSALAVLNIRPFTVSSHISLLRPSKTR
jgi:hypothetical protein